MIPTATPTPVPTPVVEELTRSKGVVAPYLESFYLDFIGGIVNAFAEKFEALAAYYNREFTFADGFYIVLTLWLLFWLTYTGFVSAFFRLARIAIRLVWQIFTIVMMICLLSFYAVWYVATFPIFLLSAIILFKYDRTNVYHQWICLFPYTALNPIHRLFVYLFERANYITPKVRQEQAPQETEYDDDFILYAWYQMQQTNNKN